MADISHEAIITMLDGLKRKIDEIQQQLGVIRTKAPEIADFINYWLQQSPSDYVTVDELWKVYQMEIGRPILRRAFKVLAAKVLGSPTLGTRQANRGKEVFKGWKFRGPEIIGGPVYK